MKFKELKKYNYEQTKENELIADGIGETTDFTAHAKIYLEQTEYKKGLTRICVVEYTYKGKKKTIKNNILYGEEDFITLIKKLDDDMDFHIIKSRILNAYESCKKS